MASREEIIAWINENVDFSEFKNISLKTSISL